MPSAWMLMPTDACNTHWPRRSSGGGGGGAVPCSGEIIQFGGERALGRLWKSEYAKILARSLKKDSISSQQGQKCNW